MKKRIELSERQTTAISLITDGYANDRELLSLNATMQARKLKHDAKRAVNLAIIEAAAASKL